MNCVHLDMQSTQLCPELGVTLLVRGYEHCSCGEHGWRYNHECGWTIQMRRPHTGSQAGVIEIGQARHSIQRSANSYQKNDARNKTPMFSVIRVGNTISFSLMPLIAQSAAGKMEDVCGLGNSKRGLIKCLSFGQFRLQQPSC